MTYYVHITRTARAEIVHAADHIELSLSNPVVADELLTKAEKTLEGLSQFPERNRIIDNPILSDFGVRYIAIDNYLAFYIVSEEERVVYVFRFLYAKRDWASILKRDLPPEC